MIMSKILQIHSFTKKNCNRLDQKTNLNIKMFFCSQQKNRQNNDYYVCTEKKKPMEKDVPFYVDRGSSLTRSKIVHHCQNLKSVNDNLIVAKMISRYQQLVLVYLNGELLIQYQSMQLLIEEETCCLLMTQQITHSKVRNRQIAHDF